MSNEKKTEVVQHPPTSTMTQYLHPSSFDPHNIMNMALTSMISEQLFSVLKSQEGLTFQKIVKLLAITSIDEVRKALMICIKKLFTLFGENYILIFKYIDKYIIRNIFVTTIYNLYRYIKRKIFPKEKLICPEVSEIEHVCVEITPLHTTNIRIKLEKSFVASLFNYVNSNKSTAHYEKTKGKEFTLINNQKFTISEIWSRLIIQYESILMCFNAPLEIIYTNANGKLLFESYKLSNSSVTKKHVDKLTKEECDNIRTISDLIQDPEIRKSFREEILKYVPSAYDRSIVKNHGLNNTSCFHFNYISCGNGVPGGNYTILNLIEYFQTKFTNLNVLSSFWELDFIFEGQNMDLTAEISRATTPFELFNCHFTFKNSDILGVQSYRNHLFGSSLFGVLPNKSAKFKKGFLNKVKYFTFEHTTEQEQEQKTDSCIPIKITSETLDEEQISKAFENFINYINTFVENKQLKEPVKSFIIKIEREERIEQVPNPDYVIYQRKKKEIDLLIESEKSIHESDSDVDVDSGPMSGKSPSGRSSSSKSSKTSKSSKSKKSSDVKNTLTVSLLRLLSDIPPETIDKVHVDSKIKLTEVNEIYKSFENLYLRKEDKTKLKNMLEMFYDNKELMIDYGIPHKLGILLHGLPGTGKTTTIQVIATWLKKNIYCVDLKSIKTNKDFFLIVENICKHCVNGGILVLEDFDAMGKVMHKRSESSASSETLVDLMEQENCELTLDYILNILQGSLTPSGFVFILTTNHIEKIDEAVYRDGRIDIKIDMKLCNHFQIQSIYRKFIKREIPDDILQHIHENKWTPANIIFRLVQYVKDIKTDEEILEPFIE
jgi:signal recognition particle GTPase